MKTYAGLDIHQGLEQTLGRYTEVICHGKSKINGYLSKLPYKGMADSDCDDPYYVIYSPEKEIQFGPEDVYEIRELDCKDVEILVDGFCEVY